MEIETMLTDKTVGLSQTFVPQPELWLQKQQPCIVQSKAAQAEKLQQRRYL